MKSNALFYGDNLQWLRDHKYFPDESVDLIYLDPPFNSKADYNLIFNEPGKLEKSEAQIKAFADSWHWDSEASDNAHRELAANSPDIAQFISWLGKGSITYRSLAAYLSMMAVRLIELHRVLKDTGSLYLHCDPTASHYLKIILDKIFGNKCFANEIIWRYRRWPAKQRAFQRMHDVILRYVKTPDNSHNWNQLYEDLSPSSMKQWKGKLRVDVTSDKGTRHSEISDNASPGVPMSDVWEISQITGPYKEYLGYPTQKPEALLERIIKASSNEGDIVLDPFCGCGTSIIVAEKFNRRWLGIDVTWLAIDLIEKRLKDFFQSYDKRLSDYKIHGHPVDTSSAKALAEKSKKEFEIWAITLVGAAPRERDNGVDGIFGFVDKDKKTQTIVVQVKGGETLSPTIVRDLIGTVQNEGAAIGLLITMAKPTKGMMELAVHAPLYKSETWGREFPSIQIRTVEELLSGKGFDLPPTQSPLKKAKVFQPKSETGRLF